MRLARVGASARWRVRRARWLTLNAVAGAAWYTRAGSVALTFDDGPQPGSTDRLLDILQELDVQATFFCVGANAARHPGLTRRIEADGHRLGSHSLTHPHPAQTSLRALAEDYRHGREAVEDVVGHDVALFRPPHGHVDLAQALLLRRLRLRSWLWSVDPEDWQPAATEKSISSLVQQQAFSGSVVLMHDWVEQPVSSTALDRSSTLAAIPPVVAALRRRGLTFSGLP